jgi:hypothetical protein
VDGGRRRLRRGGYLTCDAAAARDRLSVPAGGEPGAGVYTVAQWLETWIETRPRLRDSTRRVYKSRHPPGGPAPAGHSGPRLAFGVLFADAIGAAADPVLADVSGQVLRALAGHLADLVRRGQEDGSIRAGLAPEAVAWLLISVLAARPLREAAMPAGLEAQVADLTVGLLTAPPPR